MPTAPSLNRPPRASAALRQPRSGLRFGSTFARPPAPRQTPTGGAALTNAAIGAATKGNPQINPGGARRPPAKPGVTTLSVGTDATKPVSKVTGGGPLPIPKPLGSVKPPGTVQSTGLHTGPTPGAPGSGVTSPPPSQATVQDPGAPPGTPDTGAQAAQQFNIPLVPADEAAKANAIADYNTAASGAMGGIQGAALAYGDPSLMSAWGLGATANPNSALALAALRAQEQQQAATGNRERAGTLFSSLALQDRSRIGDTQKRAQLAGYQRYQNALARFNQAMTAATEARDRAVDAANQDERQNAINTLPTANTTAAGGFQGGSTNLTGKVPTAAPAGSKGQGSKGGKTPTLKPGANNKTNKAGKGRSTKITSNKPGAVTKVKTGTRRISGGKGRK